MSALDSRVFQHLRAATRRHFPVAHGSAEYISASLDGSPSCLRRSAGIPLHEALLTQGLQVGVGENQPFSAGVIEVNLNASVCTTTFVADQSAFPETEKALSTGQVSEAHGAMGQLLRRRRHHCVSPSVHQ